MCDVTSAQTEDIQKDRHIYTRMHKKVIQELEESECERTHARMYAFMYERACM